MLAVITMFGRVQQLHQLWQHMGPDWLAYRLSYATRIRSGALRRKMPATPWNEQPLERFLNDASLSEPENYLEYRSAHAPGFFFSPELRPKHLPFYDQWDSEDTPVTRCNNLEQGKLRYFEHDIVQAGFPPDWHANPFTGQQTRADFHWSEIRDFDFGDIKIIWEPSRFAFTYTLVRAYWRTGDQRYAEMFWQLVEDWRNNNPPQLGVNWKCGQEISFRVMAWCFGLYGFFDAEATTAARVARLAQMIAVSGVRVEANLDYALSQNNNHGISEAVGLWTIGVLFPELQLAEQWKETGRRALESQGRELIYDDGAFSQHSVNYHRLMLHDYLWALRLGEIARDQFSDELRVRVEKACNWLFQIQDATSGRVPYYGQNDGALILPLNNCDYQDFRPVIQAVQYLLNKTRAFPAGPWDEDLLWLFGSEALSAQVINRKREDWRAETGGYYTLRADEGFVFTRCGTFRHRPAQADLLHVDVWWHGQNIAIDAGTFSYNAAEPWNNPLAHTAYHNTVSVDERDQMERVGKFLWLPWARGRARTPHRSNNLAYFEGEHDGYARWHAAAHYHRAVVRLGEHWLVLDDLESDAEHLYRLHWLLADVPYEMNEAQGALKLETVAGSYYLQTGSIDGNCAYSIVRADESSPRGWRAPYYNYREPALSLELTARTKAIRFVSLFGPEPSVLTQNEESLGLQTGAWQATVTLNARANARQAKGSARQSLVAAVSIRGAVEDRLETV